MQHIQETVPYPIGISTLGMDVCIKYNQSKLSSYRTLFSSVRLRPMLHLCRQAKLLDTMFSQLKMVPWVATKKIIGTQPILKLFRLPPQRSCSTSSLSTCMEYGGLLFRASLKASFESSYLESSFFWLFLPHLDWYLSTNLQSNSSVVLETYNP